MCMKCVVQINGVDHPLKVSKSGNLSGTGVNYIYIRCRL